MVTLLRISLLVCLTSVSLGVASADVLFSDFNGTSAGLESIGSSGPLADSFSTGGTQFSLTQVSVVLSGMTTSGFVSINLLSDSNTSPGAVLTNIGTLSNFLLTPSATRFDFTLSSPFTLNANTRYWIQLGSATTTDFWHYTLDSTGPGVSGEFFADSTGVHSNTLGPYFLEVSGNVVPEPSVFVLTTLGLASLVWRRRIKAR